MIAILVFVNAIQTTVRAPEIATAAGITVGKTTIQGFERRYGKGLVLTGGHPRGAREWYDETSHVLIDADGFYFTPPEGRKEVIDSLSIEWMAERDCERKVPRIRLKQSQLGFLAKLKPGMSSSRIEGILHLKLKSGMAKAAGLIKYSGILGNKNEHSDRFTAWEATFSIDGKTGLQSVSIHGE
ncbi:MAG: hypothetical protein ACHQ50_11750 [Fimbriimonadales bacterium]